MKQVYQLRSEKGIKVGKGQSKYTNLKVEKQKMLVSSEEYIPI